MVGIRSWTVEDAPALAACLNNPRVQDNLRDGMPFPYTAADGVAYITNLLTEDTDRQFAWAVTLDGAVVGSIGVTRQVNVHRLTAEMGYSLAEGYWGRGIMTEAVVQVCDWLFAHTDLERIFAEPYAFNVGSCRVLEKAGFELEGRMRRNAIKKGVVVDMFLYARVREG